MTERGDAPEATPPGSTPPEPTPPEPAAGLPTDSAPEPALPPPPVVAWDTPAPAYRPPPGGTGIGSYSGGTPAFTIGALLSDSFARYGADPIRFFALSAVASMLSILGTYLSLPFGSSPFGLASDASGLVSLLGFVVGLVTSSAMFALAEGGSSMPFGRVLRRGVERAGWMFLTSLLLGLGAFVILLIALIPIVVLGLISPMAMFFAFIPVVLVFIWLGLRVALAIPANVADNLNSIEALQLSWRATARAGVWLRILGAGLLIGLLFLPAAAGAGLLLLLALFGGQPILLLVVSILFAFFTPLSSLVPYSAYRRLVPPLQPTWTSSAGVPAVPVEAAPAVPPSAAAPATEASIPAAGVSSPAAVAHDPEAVAPVPEAVAPVPEAVASVPEGAPPVPEGAPPAPPAPAATFRAPVFDVAAKAILALVIALDVAGVAAVPYVVGEFAAGRVTFPRFPTSPGGQLPGFPDGEDFVVQGTISFGTSADIASCTVQGQNFVLPASGPIVWVAAFDHTLSAGDQVSLRVSRDGEEIRNEAWPAATGRCLGVDQPEPGMAPGIYVYQVLVNGRVEAAGTLIVQ